MSESFVQVAADSTGKKIRNLSATVLQPDGTTSTVQMQVVALVDEEGNPVRFSDGHDVQQTLLDELRAVRVGIQMLVDWLNPLASTVRVQPPPVGRSFGQTRGDNPLPLSDVEENELIEIARDMRQDDDI